MPGWTARVGAVDADLGVAIRVALTADRADCVAYAANFRWEACVDQFVAGLADVEGPVDLSP